MAKRAQPVVTAANGPARENGFQRLPLPIVLFSCRQKLGLRQAASDWPVAPVGSTPADACTARSRCGV